MAHPPAPEPPTEAVAERPPVHPLVAEAMRKAALIWIEVPGERARAAWTVWHDGAAYVVHGGGEQPVPGLGEATQARIVVRSGDNGSRVAAFQAAVSPVDPAGEEWSVTVPLLLAKRLNLPSPGDAEQRWATSSGVSRLVPVGDPEEPSSGSLAEPPPPSPATTPAPIPRTLHRKPRR
ncbi:MAG: hypothetical protein JWO79_1518 [Actinomycetia bacterium]|jgi:hypothetical protein|nr:hypothetical protein [Actinomycetes bacterium]